jgi:hypothetical protein
LSKIKEADPDALKNGGMMRICKVLGQQWNTMSPDERSKYDEMNRENKERYEKEREVYKDSLKKKSLTRSGSLILKKAKSAFSWFVHEEMEKMKADSPDMSKLGNYASTKEVLKTKWAEMMDEDKVKFEGLAKKDRARYFDEKRAAKHKSKGPKRPRSAFAFYSKEVIENIKLTEPDALKNGGLVKIIKAIGKRWSTMTPGEKSKYEILNHKDRLRYKNEKKAHKFNTGDSSDVSYSKNHLPKTPPKRAMSAFLCFFKRVHEESKIGMY